MKFVSGRLDYHKQMQIKNFDFKVELLVMRALSLELIKGFIDEIEQKIHVTWVKPRVLDLNQVFKILLR